MPYFRFTSGKTPTQKIIQKNSYCAKRFAVKIQGEFDRWTKVVYCSCDHLERKRYYRYGNKLPKESATVTAQKGHWGNSVVGEIVMLRP